MFRMLFAAIMVCGISAWTATPANPETNAKAIALLNYFEQLVQRPDARMLSGQFCGSGSQASTRPCEEVQAVTGHWPAIIGLDYIDHPTNGLNTAVPNQAAIAYAKAGGWVTLSAHLYNPANPAGGGLRDQGVDLKPLLFPGTDTYTRWMAELDILAAGLAELQAAEVPVLWRPFHEMNGGWFWWGDRDPNDFIALWRQMFTYFTDTKKLNNLLWVYGPNHGRNTGAYYPGDRYVDLAGLDAYTDFVAPDHIFGYDEIATLPKPFAFTEFGPHASKDPPGDYDYLRFLTGVKEHFPRSVYFLSWSGNWGLMKNQHTKELLADPWIVNRDTLPPLP